MVLEACGKTWYMLVTYHANFCCHEIAESIEPFHIGLKVTCLLLFTETSLRGKKAQKDATVFQSAT